MGLNVDCMETRRWAWCLIEDELEIAMCVEDEAVLEEALQADIEASVEMPCGKIKDLPPPPLNQKEVEESPFREAFEHSK